MTDDRPTVPPIENHYALLRNNMVARPQMSDWPETFYYYDPFMEIKWAEDGKCDPPTDDSDLRVSFREYDVVATFTREQLGFALSLSQKQLDFALTHQALKAKMAVLEEENDKLRGIIANSDIPCVYCGLSKEDMNKCESGFLGCGRADDMLLTMDFTEELPEPREPEAQDDKHL